MSNWGWGGFGWGDPQRPLRQMVRRLELENSILIGQDVFHHVKQQGPAVAWSVAEDIYFNAARLPVPDTKENIVFITGVNKHELAHVLYTPTPQDIRDLVGTSHPMYKPLMSDANYQAAFNILEDQRIEMLLKKRYANVRPYLVSAFTKIIMESDNDGVLDVAYMLARGRRYLPVKVRRLLKRRFKVQAIIPDIRRIIDAYLKLNLFKSGDIATAHVLIEAFRKLMEDHQLWTDTGFDSFAAMDECKSVTHMAKAPADPDGEERDGTKATEATHQGNADPQEVMRTVQAVADDVEADTGGGGQGDDAEDAQDGSDGSDDESGPTTAGSGMGSGRERIDTDAIKSALGAILNAELSSDEVDREVMDVRTFIRTQPDLNAPTIREWGQVPETLPALARKLSNKLRKLEVDADPYWERQTPSGRLNVQRVMMRPNDRDHAFDRWEDGGMGGNDQEWVVLLDCSGSMEDMFAELSRSAWTIKRACDLMRATCTIIAYGSAREHRGVYKPTDRANGQQLPGMPELGGTQPGSALLQAHSVLSNSRKAQKGLLILTDGSWDPEAYGFGRHRNRSNVLNGTPWSTADQVIQHMGQMNVMTHLVYLAASGSFSAPSQTINKHGCKTGGRINSVEDLPAVMEDLIASRITKAR